MSKVLVYSETEKLAKELLSAAALIGDAKVVAVNDPDLANALAADGASVLAIDNNAVALGDTAAMAEALKQAAGAAGASVVLLASNRRGKELAGRLAQAMGAGCLTDVSALKVDGDVIVCTRNAFGGATVAEEQIVADDQVIAISPKSYPAFEGADGSVEPATVEVTPTVKVLGEAPKNEEAVDISSADVLVCVGQGMDSQDAIGAVEDVAAKLGGEVACSKPLATDKGWFSESRIVGISGTMCKPTLAVTMGVSGQVQFVVGVRDAKTIVAVDTDENAPIFQFADYGLVADMAEVVPALAAAL